MGCCSSRPEKSELVALCRSRRALIRKAIDCRYTLAASHTAYFLSLASVGEALLRYALEGFLPRPKPIADAVRLPESRKSTEVDGSEDSSPMSLLHSLSDEGFHLHLSSDSEGVTEIGNGNMENQAAVHTVNYNYHMRSSMEIPNMIYRDPYVGFSDDYFHDPNYYYNRSVSPPQQPRVSTPFQLPGDYQSSAWEFFNPFSSYEQFLPGNYPVEYGAASVGSSLDSSEVRLREGIPDLEDVTDSESIVKNKMEKMIAEEFEVKGASFGNSKNLEARETEEIEETENMNGFGDMTSGISSTEIETNGNSETGLDGSGEELGSSSKKKDVEFGNGNFLVSERAGTEVEGNMDFLEALRVINIEFESVITGSKEVSRLLETEKRRHRRRNKVFKVISSRILFFIGSRFSLRHLFKRRRHLAATIMKSKSTTVELEKLVNMKFNFLSSTLEKLYLWEKKLYEEVKAEERLRAIYEKKMKRVQWLDDDRINVPRTSESLLRTKLSIAITSADVISRRIREIISKDLQPQLVELIRGLANMWKLLVACHSEQLHSLAYSKTLSPRIGPPSPFQDSVTNDLTLALVAWHANFDEWMASQRAFVGTLNQWLRKWLPKRREEGAPPAFFLTKRWSEALNRLPEADVKSSIRSFAADMRVEERKLLMTAKLSRPLQEQHPSLKENHVLAFGKAGEAASACLANGMLPIFKSLHVFASEILRAHEALLMTP